MQKSNSTIKISNNSSILHVSKEPNLCAICTRVAPNGSWRGSFTTYHNETTFTSWVIPVFLLSISIYPRIYRLWNKLKSISEVQSSIPIRHQRGESNHSWIDKKLLLTSRFLTVRDVMNFSATTEIGILGGLSL